MIQSTIYRGVVICFPIIKKYFKKSVQNTQK